jgi:hypothetical protein
MISALLLFSLAAAPARASEATPASPPDVDSWLSTAAAAGQPVDAGGLHVDAKVAKPSANPTLVGPERVNDRGLAAPELGRREPARASSGAKTAKAAASASWFDIYKMY